MLRSVIALGVLALAATPFAVQAQGLVGGAEEGAAQGSRAAGPIGGVVGGAIGAGVGTVNGALGINPRYYYYHHRRCIFRQGIRYCR